MSTTADPFDWPFPQRKDLMSLSTIKPNEFGDKLQIQRNQNNNTNLRVNDIQGAQPCLKAYQYTNKQDFVNKKEDIKGASSRQLMIPSGRQDLQLYNKDIQGTQPQINKFITNRQPSNPLEPIYRIPQAEPLIPIVPKFIRDNINIDDIDGTKPMPNFTRLRKNVIQYDEIEGSKSKAQFQPRDHIEIMDVKDINQYREFKSNRITNPLDPVYTIKDEFGNAMEIGRINGSRSRQLHPTEVKKFASSTLQTKDINGAQAGTHTQIFLRSTDRKDFRNTNNTKDVPGAQVGTLKKGIESVRRTDPLQPSYQIPGNKEIYGSTILHAGNSIARSNSVNQSSKQSNAQKLDSFIRK